MVGQSILLGCITLTVVDVTHLRSHFFSTATQQNGDTTSTATVDAAIGVGVIFRKYHLVVCV